MTSAAVTAAIASAERGDAIGAAGLLVQAAEARDGEAAMILAQWRLTGHPIRRDLALARDWFGRAAALQAPGAEEAYTALLANGAGGSDRRWREALARLSKRRVADPWARREIRLIEQMMLDAEGEPSRPWKVEAVSKSPLIRRLPNFLSKEECRFLVAMAEPLLQDALVIDSSTGQLVRHPIRSARTAGFPFISESPMLHAINRRIAAATGTSYEQGEPTQILAYAPGEEYKLHSDALANDPNQRVATFLITLDGRFTGGATEFPRMSYAWRGKVGDALFFHNVDAAGKPEPTAWHAGTPVLSGRKVILSKWIRALPLDLSGPPGRPL